MRRGGQLDAHFVTWPNLAAGVNNTHDAGLTDQPAIWRAMHQSCHEPRLELIELFTRIAEAGEMEHDLFSDVQLGAFWQSKEINTLRSDVLAELARLDVESLRLQFGEQLTVDEVHLAQVRLRRILGHARSMLHRCSAMSIALDSEPSDHRDGRLRDLGERVSLTGGNGDDAG